MPITFISELQRRQHQQAGLIPQTIWEEYFSNELTDAELKLMTSQLTDIQTRLAKIYMIATEEKDYSFLLRKAAAWFAIAFAHAENITDDTLKACGEILEIHQYGLLAYAAAFGRFSLIERIGLPPREHVDITRRNIMRESFKHRHIAITRWALKNSSYAFFWAYNQAQRDMVKNFEEEQYLRSLLDDVVQEKLKELTIRQQTFKPTVENPYFTIEEDDADLYHEIMTLYVQQEPSTSVTKTIEQLLTVPTIKNKVIDRYEHTLYRGSNYHSMHNHLFMYTILHEHFDILTLLLRCQRVKEFNLGVYFTFGNGIKRIKELFQSLPDNITTLDISDINFPEVYEQGEDIVAIITSLAGSLPFIETVYLRIDDHNLTLQNKAYKAIFSDQLKNTFFIRPGYLNLKPFGFSQDQDGSPIVDNSSQHPVAIANLARKLQFPSQVPSLQAQAAFFAHSKKISCEHLPSHVQKIVTNADMYGAMYSNSAAI